ncbi:MAG: hypothetical protein DMF40_08250 [Verrucomicrobia bacterium]|nr:MAG: hypothetical protein DMF40_08250 [Verrucomicrobiota bacterium]
MGLLKELPVCQQPLAKSRNPNDEFKSEARINVEIRRTQIRGPGNFLYAFYKLVDDRLRENSLSHHG